MTARLLKRHELWPIFLKVERVHIYPLLFLLLFTIIFIIILWFIIIIILLLLLFINNNILIIDLAFCNYFLFPYLKMLFSGIGLKSQSALGSAICQCMQGMLLQDYENCFKDWIRRLKQGVINKGGFHKV